MQWRIQDFSTGALTGKGVNPIFGNFATKSMKLTHRLAPNPATTDTTHPRLGRNLTDVLTTSMKKHSGGI